MAGSLKIIIGSMYSGKSTEMIRLLGRYKQLNKSILAINHSLDDRYDKNKIVTHNQQKMDCLSVDKLMPLLDNEDYINADIIAIEEAQFFTDLYDFTIQSIDIHNKIVIVAGLDGDYRKKAFGQILDLIPHCESVIKLHSHSISLAVDQGVPSHPLCPVSTCGMAPIPLPLVAVVSNLRAACVLSNVQFAESAPVPKSSKFLFAALASSSVQSSLMAAFSRTRSIKFSVKVLRW